MLDRLYIPSSGSYNISLIPRSASENLTIKWYDVDAESVEFASSTLTWSSAPIELTADVKVGDRKFPVETHTLNQFDNFCTGNGYFNSVESVDGNDIYAYCATPKKLIGTGETPDSIYPTAASLAIPTSVVAWHQYIIKGTGINLSVYVLDANGLDIPLSEATIRDEYPTIYNQIVRFRNVKNLITMTLHKDTMPNFLHLTEEELALPFYISEIGSLLMYDVIEKILMDLSLSDRDNKYEDILNSIRQKRSKKWVEVNNLIQIKTEDGNEATEKKYFTVGKWSRGL